MTSKVTYNGELSTTMIHVKSGTAIDTDAPVDNRGLGASFSPTDFAATSLASCMMTIMGIKARDKGWNIQGSHIEVTKLMASDPRRIRKVILTIYLNHQLDMDDDKKYLEQAARTCPVALSLHPDIDQEIHFNW